MKKYSELITVKQKSEMAGSDFMFLHRPLPRFHKKNAIFRQKHENIPSNQISNMTYTFTQSRTCHAGWKNI